MKKLLFTALVSFLAVNASQAIERPFMKRSPSKTQEKIAQYQKNILPFVQLAANQRVSNITPDSVTFYEHDGAAWELSLTGKVTYNGASQPTRVLLHLPPPLLLPVADVVLTYNAAGKVTSIQQNILFPVPSVEMRIEQNFDANQNATSIKMYENTGSSLELVSGDSAKYTYSGGTFTVVETSNFDQMSAAWMKSDRISGFQLNAAGEISAVSFQYWDQLLSNWSTETRKYASLAWGLGYPGTDFLFNLRILDANAFLTILPAADYNDVLAPTSYVEWTENGSVVDTTGRASSISTAGRVSQVTVEAFSMGNWIPDYRYNYNYDASNRLVMLTEQSYSGTAWEDEYRTTWSFNAQNNLTKEEFLFHDGIAFVIGGGQEYEYLYSALNIPYQVITKSHDGTAYVFSDKTVYNFGGFSTDVSGLTKSNLQAYPNPVTDVLTIRFENGIAGSAQLSCFNLAGQLVSQKEVLITNGENTLYLPMAELEAGIYLVKIQTATATEMVRIVK